tara:strand:- start:570 stop:746 length:177 start_codon:yes stop_codon:yes gene_type:complete
MQIVRKESYNHRTTASVEWKVIMPDGFGLGTFKTKKEAQKYLDAIQLTKEQFKLKYPN